MTLLDPEQIDSVVAVAKEYLHAPPHEGQTPEARQLERDAKRVSVIGDELAPLVRSFLDEAISLPEFKTRVDGVNKRHQYWGFAAIKGQMFFNMLQKAAADEAECAEEVRQAIEVPRNEDAARSRMRTFARYVARVGEDLVDAGGSPRSKPRVSSVPYFLSYFWQLQDRETWPVYYTNSVNVMTDMNLWQPTGELAEDYVVFKRVHEELAKALSTRLEKLFGLYEVEHVFWFRDGNPYGGDRPAPDGDPRPAGGGETPDRPDPHAGLPQSYVPPIVGILPRLALNDSTLERAARASATTIPNAFEKHVHAAFVILGYETRQLGQGHGRVPDGVAEDNDNSYVIIWDAKARCDPYSFGTDDRVVREYVTTISRQIRRTRRPRNLYYAMISGHFADGYEETIRDLKMETDINEVCLIEAGALVEMVEAKLRRPQEVTLGPDGLQRLYSVSGIVSASAVQDELA